MLSHSCGAGVSVSQCDRMLVVGGEWLDAEAVRAGLLVGGGEQIGLLGQSFRALLK